MSGHPVATPEQHAHEKAALALWEHPVVAAARDEVRADWLEKEQPSPVMRECFDWAFEEVMFSAAIWSSNQDPHHPEVTCITRLEHEVDGLRIPGTRWGIDNPDSIYRVIPISVAERYEIRGRVGAHRMTENYFTLWDANMGTEGLLNGHDLVTDADGSFVITVDADPQGSRPNHVQSTPNAHEFYIRDVMLDWGVDDPNWLEIVRLGPTTAAPLTDDEQAHRTAAYMRKFADFSHGLSKGMTMGKPNRFHLAHSADQGGALRNQVYVGGHFQPRGRRGVRHRRERRRRPLLHRADLQRVGHDDGDRRPHRQPQQGAVRAERRRHLDLRAHQRRSRRTQLGRPVRAHRGHPHAADGGVPGPAADRRAVGVGPGGEARRPRVGAAAGNP